MIGHIANRFLSRRLAILQLGTSINPAFPSTSLAYSHARSIYLKSTGLFGIDELRKPDGFHTLRSEAITTAGALVEEVIKASKRARSDSNVNGNNYEVVEIFDELSNCLCKVADLAEFIRIGHPNPRYQATAEHASMAISSLVEKLNTDKRLYQALKDALQRDPSHQDDDYNLDEYVAKLFIFDFEQSGIHLDSDKRDLLLQLNENILRLGSIFTANANQPRLVHKSFLPSEAHQFFPSDGDTTLITGLFADSDDENIREAAYKLYLQVDERQEKLLSELLHSRSQLAQLCGFKSYAHRAVKGSIISTPETIWEFLDILNERIRPLAQRDYDQMLELKLQANCRSKQLNAWDVPYCSSRYKQSTYSEQVMRCLPYFSAKSCLGGLNMIFAHLYDIRMQPTESIRGELWHNDVTKLAIVDNKTNEQLGIIYCDLFERPGKPHQDCHFTIRGGCHLRDGSYQQPVVVLMLSLPQSNDSNPSLLSPSMVDNLFHEMGHAMHSMLARTKYQHITGTRCSTDLAEVPSILMEFFASDARVVSKFARHYATHEPMPTELMQTWIKSKRIFTASETQLQVFYAALDQAYHGVANATQDVASSVSHHGTTTDILARIQTQYYSIPYVENTAWQLRFSHLVGYGAKYYSYLVSRAIASAIWAKLFANDPLSRRAGLQYQDQVLRHGGGRPAKSLIEDVLNCDVNADFIASSFIKNC